MSGHEKEKELDLDKSSEEIDLILRVDVKNIKWFGSLIEGKVFKGDITRILEK